MTATESGVHVMAPVYLHPSRLVFVYIIVPIAAGFLLLDYRMSGLAVSRSLPADPHSIQWFNMLFMLPHIFSSAFTFLDADYVRYYRGRLLWSTLAFLALLGAVFLFGLLLPFVLFISVYTIYHLVGQQTGIASMLARNKSRAHVTWKWLTFGALALVYLGALSGSAEVLQALVSAFPYFCAGYLGLSCYVARQARERSGRNYIVANSVMIAFCYLLYIKGLPFFMILIPRFVHDVTAYFFYITHDSNRNRDYAPNLVARMGRRLSLPAYVVTPLAGFLSTGLAMLLLGRSLPLLIAFMALFHYYWEGIMWKSDGLHRRQIRFAPGAA